MKKIFCILIIFIFVFSTACSSNETSLIDDEETTKESETEKPKKNDFDDATYKISYEGFDISFPRNWRNQDPYYYAEGADDRTYLAMVYLLQEKNVKWTNQDVSNKSTEYFEAIKGGFGESCKMEKVETEVINQIYMASTSYENCSMSGLNVAMKVYVFTLADSRVTIGYSQADGSIYDHFDDFEKVIHSIKKNAKTTSEEKEETITEEKKKSTDFVDSSKYINVKIEDYTIDFPEKWKRNDNIFYPGGDEKGVSIGYSIADFGGFTESWLDQAADSLYDEIGTGASYTENEKVYVNGIRMQRIVADLTKVSENGLITTEYLFVNPVTTNAITIFMNEPADAKIDYSDDFEKIVHSIRHVESVQNSPKPDQNEIISDETGSKDEEIIDIPFNPIYEMTGSYNTQYAHFFDSVVLGNNEKMSVEIEAEPAGLTIEDFSFEYDKKLLSYTVDSINSDDIEDITTVNLTIKAIKAGHSVFEINSSYYRALFDDDDEDAWLSIEITGLNSTEGRIVYMAPTGERYHFSKDCAGENYIETTLYDVESMEIKPCGKCVK